MRGGWISHTLSKSFSELIVRGQPIENSIVVILKQDASNIPLLSRLKDSNNILILDIIDWLDPKKYSTEKNKNQVNFFPELLRDYYDGYIVSSSKMRTWWYENMDTDKQKSIFVIPHHWEQRFAELPAKQYPENPYFYYLGYIGHEKQNCLYIDNLLKNNLLQEHRFNNGYYIDRPINGVQLSVRKTESWEYCFKPATKLVVAACMESLMITTNDWSVQDLIDPSYPYLLKDDSYDSLVSMIQFVKDTYKGKTGDLAKKILKDCLQLTCLETSIKSKYESIIKHYS